MEILHKLFVALHHELAQHWVHSILLVLVLRVNLDLRHLYMHHFVLVIHLADVFGSDFVQVADHVLDLEQPLTAEVLLDNLLVDGNDLLLDGVFALENLLSASDEIVASLLFIVVDVPLRAAPQRR